MIHKYAAHYPALLKLGIPIMIGQLGTIMMGIADTLMIGRHSTHELAAAGFVNNIFGLVFITAMGFSYGMTPIIGKLLGEDQNTMVGSKLKNGIAANLAVGLLLMFAMGILFINIDQIGLPNELIPILKPYYLVIWVSILPNCIFNAFKQFSDAVKDTRTPMWILLSSNLANVVGNYILIFGLLGIPELGLLGAGIATLASRVFMASCFVIYFFYSNHFKSFKQQYKQARVTLKELAELIKMGYPIALQLGMETASFSLSAFFVGWIGTSALAAHQIMLSVSQLCFMLYYGLAAAVAVEVSHFHGAKKTDEEKRVSFSGLHLAWIVGVCTALPIFILRDQIGFWFNNSAEVAHMVELAIIPFVVYQFGDAMQCIYSNALRGKGDVKPMIWIAFLSYFIISLPLGYFFGFIMDWGLTGVWMAFPFGLTSAGIMYLYRFQCHKS